MRTQQSKRSRVPRTPHTAAPCVHCGTSRVKVTLGELAAFNRLRPFPNVHLYLLMLQRDHEHTTPVYVCGGCSCITTDPGFHRHGATRSEA